VNTAGCVVAALGAAVAFALAALFQQRAARREPAELSLRARLLIALARRPLWLAGVGALVSGYGLQALALALGPVAPVQPIITTELVFAVPIAALAQHGRPGRREWSGALSVVGGVSLFLSVADPASGSASASLSDWLVVVCSSATGVAIALVVAHDGGPRRRAMALAAAAGVAFAILAVLTKTVVNLFSEGLAATLGGWQTYAVVVVGILGLLLSQSAYQAGPLAFSMPVVAVVEPTVAVLVGSTVLDESVKLGGLALAAELLGACLAAVGVTLLATSDVVTSLYRAELERDSMQAITSEMTPQPPS
jgi:drug/metabolite transporter (DMT)-like permease